MHVPGLRNQSRVEIGTKGRGEAREDRRWRRGSGGTSGGRLQPRKGGQRGGPGGAGDGEAGVGGRRGRQWALCYREEGGHGGRQAEGEGRGR